MGLRDETKKRQEEKAKKLEPGHGKKEEGTRKASTSLVMGNRAVTEARRKGIMVKLVIESAAEDPLRLILRELSWMMEPASLGDLFVWIHTQAHLHKELGRHIKEAIKHQKKYPMKNIQVESRRTNLMAPVIVAEWFLAVAETPQLQTATRLILHYILANWEKVKEITGWRPAFTNPDENLWTRW